jgi:hypothetical protein
VEALYLITAINDIMAVKRYTSILGPAHGFRSPPTGRGCERHIGRRKEGVIG